MDRARDCHVTLVVTGLAEAVRLALDLGGILPKLSVEPSRSDAVTRLQRTTGI